MLPFADIPCQAPDAAPVRLSRPDTEAAVRLFPRGLVQPEGGFRFSLDALLLAAFTRPKGPRSVLLDLGTGCGVVALSLLLRHPALTAMGLDKQEAMIAAARRNAFQLGLDQRITLRCTDISRPGTFPAAAFDLVTANPPYKRPDRGRLPGTTARREALFADKAGLAAFITAAAQALQPGGRLCLVTAPARLPEIFAGLGRTNLAPARLMPVQPATDQPARLALLEAVRGGRADCALEPALVLYQGAGRRRSLSPAALAFCPELACNAGSEPEHQQPPAPAARNAG